MVQQLEPKASPDASLAAASAPKKPSWTRRILILAVAAAFAVYIWVDGPKLWDRLRAAEIRHVVFCVGSAMLSYVAMSWSMVASTWAIGARLKWLGAMHINLASALANHIMAAGGLGPAALKAHLLAREGMRGGEAIASLALFTAASNTVTILICALGFGYLVVHGELSAAQSTAAVIGLGIVFAVSFWIVLVIWSRHHRHGTINSIFGLIHRIRSRWGKGPALDHKTFLDDLDRACDVALQRKGATLLLVVFTFADWFFSLLTVYFGFRAVGANLNPGLLAAGYTAGVIASTVSFIPGGLGIFEAAGILVYTMHGNMTADTVIAGLLIYRLAYYGIPLGLALPFLHFRQPVGMRGSGVTTIDTPGRAPTL